MVSSVKLNNSHYDKGYVRYGALNSEEMTVIEGGKGVKCYKNKPRGLCKLFRKTIEVQIENGTQTVYLNKRSAKNWLKRHHVSYKGRSRDSIAAELVKKFNREKKA